MSSFAYGGDAPGLTGKYHYGVGSIGIPGSLLAADGLMGLSVSLPADADKEYYAVITSMPQGLTASFGEAGDFDVSAVGDGTYVIGWDLYQAGVNLGGTTATFKFGSGSVINLAPANLQSASTLSTVAVSVPAQQQSHKAATYSLITHGGVPQVNLSGLGWSLFAEMNPGLFTSPVAKGTLAATDASAVLSISVLASAVPAGWYMLALANADNTFALLAPVQVP